MIYMRANIVDIPSASQLGKIGYEPLSQQQTGAWQAVYPHVHTDAFLPMVYPLLLLRIAPPKGAARLAKAFWQESHAVLVERYIQLGCWDFENSGGIAKTPQHARDTKRKTLSQVIKRLNPAIPPEGRYPTSSKPFPVSSGHQQVPSTPARPALSAARVLEEIEAHPTIRTAAHELRWRIFGRRKEKLSK